MISLDTSRSLFYPTSDSPTLKDITIHDIFPFKAMVLSVRFMLMEVDTVVDGIKVNKSQCFDEFNFCLVALKIGG